MPFILVILLMSLLKDKMVILAKPLKFEVTHNFLRRYGLLLYDRVVKRLTGWNHQEPKRGTTGVEPLGT